MELLRISGKDLGYLALPDFCPRCFWIQRHAKKLPYQIFPGIFSSIDSYTKKVTHAYFDSNKKLMAWLQNYGLFGEPIKIPSNFKLQNESANTLLTGTPDEIIKLDAGSYAILDYKTAKYTSTSDELMPIYMVQLNAYADIAESVGFTPIQSLFLIYYEPQTNLETTEMQKIISEEGFSMKFKAHIVPIERDKALTSSLLGRAREIYDELIAPQGIAECKDCEALNAIVKIVQ